MESEGRPTLLDADGMAALAEFLINNQGLKVQTLKVAALRNYIYGLQLKTYCKRRRMMSIIYRKYCKKGRKDRY